MNLYVADIEVHVYYCLIRSHIQVVAGHLQFRYNLGEGEAILMIKSTNINDLRFHNVLLSRTEQSVQLLVDGMFVNRTISPGSAPTLDILSDHFYVGARINVRDGSLSNGLQGCVVGLRLDRKEVPVGGENAHFTTLKISNGVQNGCPIGTLFETPQSDTSVYTGLSVILVSLCITSFIFVMICVFIQWRRERHRMHTYNPPSREGSRRRSNRRSSGDREFAWHQPPTYRRTLDSPQGDYRSTPRSEHQSFPMISTSPTQTLEFDTKSCHPPPYPVTDVSTNPVAAETAFNANASFRERMDSISSSRRRHRLPPIQEDFSAVSQPNPGYREASPQVNHHETHDGPAPSKTTAGQPSRHTRSPSAGVISVANSVGTDLSDVTMNTSIEGDVEKYVQKRREVANSIIEELNIDTMTHYKDEGPYEPLGSIGSLYNFVRDLEADLNETTSTERSISHPPAPQFLPPHPSSQYSPKEFEDLSPSFRPKSPSSGQPAMPQEFPVLSVDDSPVKSNFSRHSTSQRSGKRSSQRSSHHRIDHSRRMNNIMDKFQSITVGSRQGDGVETRLI